MGQIKKLLTGFFEGCLFVCFEKAWKKIQGKGTGGSTGGSNTSRLLAGPHTQERDFELLFKSS